MPNLDLGIGGNAPLASARWHMECPLCHQAKGAIKFEEVPATSPTGTKITCEQCGVVGSPPYTFDFACPAGTTEIEHGKGAAILFSIWLKDHPPDVITQLAVIGRGSSPELQSKGDGDLRTTCSACGCTNARRPAGLDAEADRPLT